MPVNPNSKTIVSWQEDCLKALSRAVLVAMAIAAFLLPAFLFMVGLASANCVACG